MKVPAGKRVYVGSRLYRAGAEIPEAVAEKLGLAKPKAAKTSTTSTKKGSSGESPSSGGSGSSAVA
jgi:hypothetical protein